ncbi:MAG TPA: DUF6263 family protein [Planctomycetota bacterium]|jgi:hypothetical protein|nr:DUF6263 family protein [Planctomycetota bacterium]
MKLLIAALLLVQPAAQDKVELRWKWLKGEELIYKSVQKTQLEFGGQPMDQHMGYTYSLTIADVSESGEATITVKYLAVVTKGNGPTGEYDYDSEKDKEPPAEGPAAMQAKMVGQSFSMKMTPTGRVTDVQGYDKVLEAMTKGSGEEAAAVRAQLKQMFNNDTFKGMMQQMAPPLPDEKVGKGDSWNNEFQVKMPMIGGMSFTLKSKLGDLKDNNAHIEQDIKVELKGGDKDNPLAGLVEIKDGKGKATSVYSIEKGCFLSQKSSMDMTISVQGQSMPMKTVVELTLVSRK